MEDLILYFKDVKERIISLEEGQEWCSLPMIDKKYNIEKAKLELIKSTIVFCN